MLPNYAFERSVLRRRVRDASAMLHCALAARGCCQCAAAVNARPLNASVRPPLGLRFEPAAPLAYTGL